MVSIAELSPKVPLSYIYDPYVIIYYRWPLCYSACFLDLASATKLKLLRSQNVEENTIQQTSSTNEIVTKLELFNNNVV